MGLINITGGSVLVDDEDEWILTIGTWLISEGRVKGYIYDSRKLERLHHYIAGFPVYGYEVDHCNQNPLDNRRINLEHVTHKENVLRWARTTKGYYFDKGRGLWQVSLTVNYRRVNGGRFLKEEDAKKKADQLRRELYAN